MNRGLELSIGSLRKRVTLLVRESRKSHDEYIWLVLHREITLAMRLLREIREGA